MKPVLLPLLALAALTNPARAASLLVQSPALLEPYVPMREAIRRECDVAGQFGKFALEALNERGVIAEPAEKAAQAGDRMVLMLTIVGVDGGMPMLSRPSMMARVELRQGARTLASQVMEGSGAGLGTCSGLESVAKTFGKKAARWAQRAMSTASRGAAAANAPDAIAPAASAASALAD